MVQRKSRNHGGIDIAQTPVPVLLLLVAKPMDDPQNWRFRAEEVRTAADNMKDGRSKAIMERIAEDYERRAKLAEQALRTPDRM